LLATVAFALRWFDIGGRYSMAVDPRADLVGSGTALHQPHRSYLYARLDKAQLLALRFASDDEELPGLLERTASEKLDADQIKRAIKQWVPDWDRT